MEKAADILGAAMRRMQQPEATMAWLAGTWATIVGDQLAAHTRPVALSGGLLEVQTSGADWQNQLESMGNQFRDKINRAWGGSLVHELRFVAARPAAGTVSKAEDNQHTPFVRKRKD
jgi:predicted nucleic acid-binding Zn ribbon protein